MAPSCGSDSYNDRDTMASLKIQLERATTTVERLTAAIAFLEANPGAVALMNSL